MTLEGLKGNVTNWSSDAPHFHVYQINKEHTAQHLSTRRFKQDILEKYCHTFDWRTLHVPISHTAFWRTLCWFVLVKRSTNKLPSNKYTEEYRMPSFTGTVSPPSNYAHSTAFYFTIMTDTYNKFIQTLFVYGTLFSLTTVSSHFLLTHLTYLLVNTVPNYANHKTCVI